MKSQHALFAAAVLAASSAFGGVFPFPSAVNGDDVTLAVSADAGWLSGQASKHVYATGTLPGGGSDSSRNRLSRLDWDLKNVWLLGGAGSIRTCRLSLNGGIWAGESAGTGALDEWNWQAGGHSRQDADVASALVADGNAAFDLLGPDRTFALYPFVGFRLDRYKWEAENAREFHPGTGWTRTEPSGKNIEYRLDCVQAYVGFGSSWLIGRRFWLSAYGRFAPVYRAKDHEKRVADHYVTENRSDRNWFDDVAYGLGARAEWAITPHCWLAASVDWTLCKLAETKTSVRDSGGTGEDEEDEGDGEEGEEDADGGKKAKKRKDGKDRKDRGPDGLAGIELENLIVSLGLVWRF